VIESRAQAGQDIFVHRLHPEPGYFVDVGAHDGVTHSNTYALEEIGWTGLCIEPNVEAFKALVEIRRCRSLPVVASSTYAMTSFDGTRVTAAGTSMLAAPLTALLEVVHAPTEIGYLSIDVEGHELEVLDGMDFDRWTVDLLTIETNVYVDGTARKDAIYARLTDAGFKRVVEDVVAPGYGIFEDWFQRA
jgi:FkbM family methyltransferase